MSKVRLRLLTGAFFVMFFAVALNMIALQPRGTAFSKSVTVEMASQVRVEPVEATGSLGPRQGDTRTARHAVVRELLRAGYLDQSHVGLPEDTNRLRAAIFAFEYDHGLPLIALATNDLLEALMIALPRAPGTSLGSEGPAARELVMTIQKGLIHSGFAPGDVDGRFGRKTQAAIRGFEELNGLRPTGRISAALWVRLRQDLERRAQFDGIATDPVH